MDVLNINGPGSFVDGVSNFSLAIVSYRLTILCSSSKSKERSFNTSERYSFEEIVSAIYFSLLVTTSYIIA